MTDVLIIAAEPEIRACLRRIMQRDPTLIVVGSAGTERQALRALSNLAPQVIVVGAAPGEIDAAQLTRDIMTLQATPVIIVTSNDMTGASAVAVEAMSAGAVAAIACPKDIGDPAAGAELVRTVRTMAEVRVVHRKPSGRISEAAARHPRRPALLPKHIDLLAIGASTGGPLALKTLFCGLPRPLPVPAVVVQHIAGDFQAGFATWLAEATGHPVTLAAGGERLKEGHVFIAPFPHHMGIDRENRVFLNDEPPEYGVRPAVAVLFRSLLAASPQHVAAVLLTGMGRDGAAELRDLRQRGSLTFAQDEQSSAVFGMPGEAVRLGGADHVAAPEEIARLLSAALTPAAALEGN